VHPVAYVYLVLSDSGTQVDSSMRWPRADQWDVQEIVKVCSTTAQIACLVSAPSLTVCRTVCSANRGRFRATQVFGLVRVSGLSVAVWLDFRHPVLQLIDVPVAV
jgi:hypothetical protein